MSASTLARGPLTTYVLGVLSAINLPLGDNAPPDAAHGWQGEPNADGSNFIPWLSITAGNASVSTGSLGNSASEWQVNYFVTSSGVTRTQVESVADKARALLVATARTGVQIEAATWKIQQVRVPSIGGVTRIGQVSPSYFIQTDTYTVWVSKEST